MRYLKAGLLLAAVVGLNADFAHAAPTTSRAPADASGADTKPRWADAMLAARAQITEARQAGKGDTTAKPYISPSVQGTSPGHQIAVDVTGRKLLRLVTICESGGGNCHIWGEARLVAKDGAVTRLCDLRARSITVGWGQLLKNKNWQNHALRIGKKTFEHGIWVHSNSDVVYAIDGKYERFEACAGMDADRAKGVARFEVRFTRAETQPTVWKQLKKEYPEQTGWLIKDAGRNREQNWFGDSASNKEITRLFQAAVGQTGPAAAALRKQHNDLKQAKALPDDPRWLDLYARTCRYRKSHRLADSVWIAEARPIVRGWFDELLPADVSPDDARWQQRHAALAGAGPATSGKPTVGLTELEASAAALSKAMPGRFAASNQLRERLAACRTQWEACSPGLKRCDATAVEQLVALAGDVEAAVREIMFSITGMREFLAVPAHADLESEWEKQHGCLEQDLKNRAHFQKVAPETFRAEALILDSDRDPLDVVLRRTVALATDLQAASAVPELAPLAEDLAALQAASQCIAPEDTTARYALYVDTCRARRRIAFANPLLDFDELLVLKRHRSRYQHMCDQYYGVFALPGGGLSVIENPFGPEPTVRDILADSVVERGRLKGTRLEGGSFLSPDLSFDATQVAFAYTECEGSQAHDHHTDPSRGHWDRGRCYHVFRVNIDGSGLHQLTDGTWNDFDPCWMPSGRIAFISERRGGYLRCGRVCPTYTLYDMAPDGSDIRCLSYHETNEWHPSVTHDGRIIWTRWDYVDRHGCVAHMPWITSPDGCDPRPLHGNYSPRSARPDMELDMQAIPGSRKYLATAAPHHGQAFGSLILLDPREPDDDGMAPVKRVTPEIKFPESQGGREVYGSGWPLSEDYYLCVYDPEMTRARRGTRGNYGVYLVDSFGNRELVYRDPDIACNNPVPLRPRRKPPVVPGPTAEHAGDADQTAVVGVVDVYNSSQPWPDGTKIKALRIYQILPLSVASARTTHNIGLQIPQGSDSINLARAVLGTVPVEADGSARFVVPTQREVFFQALDEDGLAVTSMRSATQFMPGEQATCQGCHEPKHGAPPLPQKPTLAMRRAPSPIKPDMDGTNPFSYPRLVQPVLDKHCVACHTKNAPKAPRLDGEPTAYGKGRGMNKKTTYTASYVSLAPKFGFYDYGGKGWSDPKWYRTTPGEFGARASKLYPMLLNGHHKVKLPPDDLHRIVVWLDSCSVFYGVYEKEGGLAQLRGEIAHPTLE